MAKENMLNEEELSNVSGGAISGMKTIGTASVVVTGLNIRAAADRNSTCVGQTNAPAKYDVYEIVQNQGYIWYRIDKNMWIASDGTWVVFTTK